MPNYSKANLQFPNYNEATQTNDKLSKKGELLVYKDSEHTIYLTINNAAPYEIFLYDSFHNEDFVVISNLDTTRNLQEILIDYLENS